MSRPRRGTEAVFFDTFADWDVEDQAAALRVLEALHRQKRRDSTRERPLSDRDLERIEMVRRGPSDEEPENNNAAVDKPKGEATGKMGFA